MARGRLIRARSLASLAFASLAFASLALGACSKPNVRSCVLTPTGQQPVCLELQRAPNDAVAAAETSCRDDHGTWSDALCSRKDTIGGCMKRVVSQQFGAYTQVTWYYPSSTGLRSPAEVLNACRGEGGVALTP